MRSLVLVTDAFGGYGGISRYNQNLLSSLASHAQCAEVVAIPRRMPHPPGVMPAKVDFVTSAIGSKWRFVHQTLRALQNGRYDFVLCGHINLLPVASLARSVLGIRNYLIIHGLEAWHPPRGVGLSFFARRIDGFISVSQFTKRRFVDWTGLDPDLGMILPNAVDMRVFTPGQKSESLLDRHNLRNKRVMMTLGRLETTERFKGIDEVLDLLPELTLNIPNLAYLIVGDGTDRPRLEEKALRMGVADRVVFTGRVPEELKVDYYRLADAFVMPGTAEGFGIAYIEALACGLPVVGSKLDASREAVGNGRPGILVDPRAPREVRDGILEALSRGKSDIRAQLASSSHESFERRCHQIASALLGASRGNGSAPYGRFGSRDVTT